jgi:hypothetical protein
MSTVQETKSKRPRPELDAIEKGLDVLGQVSEIVLHMVEKSASNSVSESDKECHDYIRFSLVRILSDIDDISLSALSMFDEDEVSREEGAFNA